MTSIINTIRQAFNWLSGFLEKVRQNRRLHIPINIGLALFLGYYLYNFFTSEYQEIVRQKIQLSWQPLVLSLLIYGLNYGLFMICWHWVVKGYNIKIPFISNIVIYSYSQVAKILPTPAWFIANRVMQYNKEGEKKRIILSASLFEILLHMLVGFAILFLLKIRLSNPLSLLFGIIVLPVLFMILRPNYLLKLLHKNEDLQFSPHEMALIILLFSLTWIFGGIFFNQILVGCGFAGTIPLDNLFYIWILSSLFAYIGAITLGGFGVLREFSITLLLSNFLPPHMGLLVASVSRIVMTVGNIVWPLLIIGLFSRFDKRMDGNTKLAYKNNEGK